MTYDTGFVRNGGISREHFDPGVVRRELAIIRDDLHCNAVQIIGGDPERLERTAGYAAGLGLEVWFSPYPLELAPEGILALFADCAERAERLRERGAEVVFVTGVELSLMNRGFLPGDSADDRLRLLLGDPDRRGERLAEASARVNGFLRDAVAVVRARFRGPVTYAAIPFERVDCTSFDITSVELIRSAEVAGQFAEGVRTLVAGRKPVAITGFGVPAYRGAGDRGGQLSPPARRRSPRRPRPGQPGHCQGPRRLPRVRLSGPGLGAQGRLQRRRGAVPRCPLNQA